MVDAVSSDELKKLLHLKELELNSLLEITQAINSNIPEEALYKIYHFTLIANLNIQKLVLYVLDEEWVCKVNYGTKENYKNVPFAEALLTYTSIVKVGQAIPHFNEFEVVIPIFHKSTALAYVLISNNASGKDEDELTTSFIQTFTNIILVAIENKKLARKELVQQAFRKELEIASEVQAYLFPRNLSPSSKIKIKASYHPHDAIGGDYYDYIKLDENRFLVCIADVSGKGIPAALLMSNFQASLRTLVRHTTELKKIVEELNFNILDVAKGERFITFFIAIVSVDTKKIKYINAGHNPPVLMSKKEFIQLDKGTTILGVFDKLPFIHEFEIDFPTEGLVFAYTDGLTETAAESGEEYGHERLQEFLKAQKIQDDAQLHDQLYEELKKFKGKTPFPDDITYWSCRIG